MLFYWLFLWYISSYICTGALLIVVDLNHRSPLWFVNMFFAVLWSISFVLVWFGGGAPIIPTKGLARRGGPAARSWFPLSYLPSEEIGLWLA